MAQSCIRILRFFRNQSAAPRFCTSAYCCEVAINATDKRACLLNNILLDTESIARPDQWRETAADFSDVKRAVDCNTSLLIDVRSPDELAVDGSIPTSVNLPFAEVETSLRLTEQLFAERYGFPLPDEDDAIILTCRAGPRAYKAAPLFTQAGFTNVRVYGGSFLDWVENGGAVNRDTQHYLPH